MFSTILYTRGEQDLMDPLSDTVVIILHWGKPGRSRITLEQFRKAYPLVGRPRVLVVENGPPSVAAEEYGVEAVQLPRNIGYGAANNIGIRSALAVGAEFVVLLNNDIGVFPGILEAMRAAARRQNVGLVGAVVQEGNRRVYGGGRISWFRLRTELATEPVPADALHYIHGACLGITRQCLADTGFLREDLFLYWEDADYGLRARRAGFRFAVVEHPVVSHVGSSSLGDASPEKIYYLVRNALSVIRAHGSLPVRFWARAIHPWRAFLAGSRGKVAVLRALDDARRGMTGPAPGDL